MVDITKIQIYAMTFDDLNMLKDNLKTDFDDFWTFEILKEEIANTNSKYLVLLYDGQIVCFGGIKIILDEANLMNIVTKKQMRHNGFANFLLNELISISKKEKCSTITLEVNENNLSAINLYKKFGFIEVGRRKKYYRNGDTAILMTLNL